MPKHHLPSGALRRLKAQGQAVLFSVLKGFAWHLTTWGSDKTLNHFGFQQFRARWSYSLQ
jgi:hypothetical protein